MNQVEPARIPMIYGVEANISPEYARAERDKLWRKIWQEVGRVEEIPNVGDYITYEILDDSIIIVRTAPDKIRAYHNVCQHRGRRLVDTPKGAHKAKGKTKQFVCGFHGWRWDINGENTHILDQDDWKGCLTKENTKLAEVKVDSWGGWLFINMDLNSGSLREWLEPVATYLDPYQFEKHHYRWRRWTIFDCNWKTGMEAFLESYHVEATHPQFFKYADWYTVTRPQGRHTNSVYAPREKSGAALETLMRTGRGDARIMTAELQRLNWEGTNGVSTQTMVDAADRLVHELPEGTPAPQVMKHWMESAKRDDAARGVIWPEITPEQLSKSGGTTHFFPQFKLIQLPTATMGYNFRPYGYDPDKCIAEVFVTELFPPGHKPDSEWIYTALDDREGWLSVLPQDFSNMVAVQQGMKSMGFKGPRPNPIQENVVSHFHKNLSDFMGTEPPRPLK